MAFFLGFLLFAIACEKDDDERADLKWDGANQAAPDLVLGNHEAAAKFPARITSEFAGKFLDRVEYYIEEIPVSTQIKIYRGTSGTDPQTLVYEQDVTTSVQANRWNDHVLTEDISIEPEDLWLVVRVQHNGTYGSVGCDPGPANADGDWLFSDSDAEWITLRQRTNSVTDINWNIRGHLRD